MKSHLRKGKHLIWTPLQIQIFVLVVSLFSLVFALTLFSIYNAAYNQAERQFIARLNVGRNVFLNEIANAKAQLDLSVDTIAKDWALRSAIGGGEDAESIRSVLFNFGNRIEADIALVLDKQYQLIAQYGGEEVAIVNALAMDLDDSQKQKAWIAMVGTEPFLMSAEAIRAPSVIGWLIVGKKLNLTLMERIKTLISLDINIAAVSQNESSIALSTTTNSKALEEELQNLAKQFSSASQDTDMRTLDEQEVATLPFELFEGKQQTFIVVLQDSTKGWMKTLKLFMLELLPFFLLGLLLAVIGSYYIARTITRPVGRLLEAAKLVASGRYTETINVSGRSELGELAKEFGNMQVAVMEREQKITDQAEEIRQTNKAKYQIEMVRKEQLLAVSATEAKGRFLANVSHELRTPLNSIIGYSEMLMDSEVTDDDKAKATQAINNGGQYLLNIVNDVLDLSKIEAGKIQLECVDTCMVSLVAEVQSYMEGFAREKNLEFGLKLNYPLPSKINIDPTRLKQILLNLCNNAIKFTTEGRVDLQIYLDKKRDRFIFVVSDTGLGMNEEQQLRLFTAFSQGQQSTDRRYGGTGLGLYISKQLIEMMGGHIKVTSQEGLGSQFAVYLPWQEASTSVMLTSQKQADSILQNRQPLEQQIPRLHAHILCVDDNEDNLRLVDYLLSKTGATTSLAQNGIEALNQAEENSYDLILMDMQMPEMDGLEATKQLIEKGYNKPIIMLTANVDSDSKKQIKAAGAAAHFGKPINTERFYAMLKDNLSGNQSIDAEEDNVPQGFANLVEQYRKSFGQKSGDIQQAMEQQDWSELKHLMHKIKGSAGSYGFDSISQFALDVEVELEQENYPQAIAQTNKILQLLQET